MLRNGYQLLHTDIVLPDVCAIEIQIRTHEMHRNAQSGTAAHWHDKETASLAAPMG